MPNYVTTRILFEGEPSRINELMTFIKGEEEDNVIDFNKIIPMPKSLELPSGSMSYDAIKCFISAMYPNIEDFGIPKIREFKISHSGILPHEPPLTTAQIYEMFEKYKTISDNPEVTGIFENVNTVQDLIEIGRQYCLNLIQYGYIDWYDWCCYNWGTKWNSYDGYILSENEIEFTTAWTHPAPVIYKLSKMFPDIKMTCAFADEDFGYNTGKYYIQNGEYLESIYPDGGSKEAYELAAEIFEEDLDDVYGFFVYDKDLGTYRVKTDEEIQAIDKQKAAENGVIIGTININKSSSKDTPVNPFIHDESSNTTE